MLLFLVLGLLQFSSLSFAKWHCRETFVPGIGLPEFPSLSGISIGLGQITWQSFTAPENWPIVGVWVSLFYPFGNGTATFSLHAGQGISNGGGGIKPALRSKNRFLQKNLEELCYVDFDSLFTPVKGANYTLALNLHDSPPGYWNQAPSPFPWVVAGYYDLSSHIDVVLPQVTLYFAVRAYPPPPCECVQTSDCPPSEKPCFNMTCDYDTSYCVEIRNSTACNVETTTNNESTTIAATMVIVGVLAFAMGMIIFELRHIKKEHPRLR